MAARQRLSGAARLERALARIDEVHAGDPEREPDGSPRELVYARRMSAWLEKRDPAASEALRLAVRCQHLRRWAIRRGDYPAGAAGYRKWRTDEAAAHAALAKAILEETGYDAATVERVRSLVLKQNLKRDHEAQLLEDVTCLVFLENYFADFSRKHDEPTLVRILAKTWNKMSSEGRAAALALELPPSPRAMVEKALAKGAAK